VAWRARGINKSASRRKRQLNNGNGEASENRRSAAYRRRQWRRGSNNNAKRRRHQYNISTISNMAAKSVMAIIEAKSEKAISKKRQHMKMASAYGGRHRRIGRRLAAWRQSKNMARQHKCFAAARRRAHHGVTPPAGGAASRCAKRGAAASARVMAAAHAAISIRSAHGARNMALRGGETAAAAWRVAAKWRGKLIMAWHRRK